MSLEVYSARIDYAGAYRLDVTAKSATDGLFMAPPWAILQPALRARDEVKALRASGQDGAAEALDRALWERFVMEYRKAMRVSYACARAKWDWLLGLERVVLVCYCPRADQCHRAILRTEILPRCGPDGAHPVDCGELQRDGKAWIEPWAKEEP